MRLAILALAFVLSLAQMACAQSLVNGTTPLPPGCGMLGTNAAGGVTCNPVPSGGGSSISIVSGDPACLTATLSGTTVTITPKWSIPAAKTGSYPMTVADECSTIPYAGTAAGTFTLPPVAGLHNGFTVCWDDVAGTSQAPIPLTIAVAAAPTIIYSGPTTYGWDQSNCAQLDANNNWILMTVVSADIPNPNPFK